MRSLSATLTQAQKDCGDALCKLVLTSGATTKTYGLDTTNRILNLSHNEQQWSQTAQVVVDNRDGNLTALTLEGYQGVISYGFHTTSDEYSACAPLEVISQKSDSLQGELVTSFGLAGVFDMMGEDEASAAYSPEDTNADTIKTILTAIANITMACFTHCKSYTITFDSEDSLIDTFTPKDYFSVSAGESRLSAFKKALAFTKCKARIEDDGEIHVFSPTITGTTYDYEYNDAISATNHNFFDKSVRTRLVIPNKQIVSSHPDHTPPYTGNAVDAASYASLGRYMTAYKYARVTSNAQCTSIAEAMMQNFQLDAEKGHGIAPMNCGQEVMDYVKITDSRANDTRIGNVGYLNRWYSYYDKEPTRFGFEFRFGKLAMGGISRADFGTATGYVSYDVLSDALDQVYDDMYDMATILWTKFIERDTVPKWHVTQHMRIPTPNYTLGE